MNDAVSAKAQADAKASQDAARTQAAANAPSNVDGGYIVLLRAEAATVIALPIITAAETIVSASEEAIRQPPRAVTAITPPPVKVLSMVPRS